MWWIFLLCVCDAHLSTNGAHLMNVSTGERVRLRCVEYREPSVDLAGANCVRLPLVGGIDTVVESLTYDQGLMVILAADVSSTEWVYRYSSNPLVVGVDLRNDNSADLDWLAAVTTAEEGIGDASPDMLIFVSGLCRAYDIRPLMNNPGPTAALYRRKLVFTTHIYTFSWWWAQVYWLWVMYSTIITFIIASLLLICINAAQPFCCCDMVVFGAAFVPFAVLWIVIACVNALVAREYGCESMATESNPWIVVGSLVLFASCACVMTVSMTSKEITMPLLRGFLCWIRVMCVGIVLFLYVGDLYWIRHWRLEKRSIPLFVAEFGTVIGDSTAKWRV